MMHSDKTHWAIREDKQMPGPYRPYQKLDLGDIRQKGKFIKIMNRSSRIWPIWGYSLTYRISPKKRDV